MSDEVKRYSVYEHSLTSTDMRVFGCYKEVVLASDYAAKEAECAQLKAELTDVRRKDAHDGWLGPQAAARVIRERDHLLALLRDIYTAAVTTGGRGWWPSEPWSDLYDRIREVVKP